MKMRQPKIMLDVKQVERGFTGDMEDYDPRDTESMTSQQQDSFPVARITK